MGAGVQGCRSAWCRSAWSVLLAVTAVTTVLGQQPTFRAGVTLVNTDVIARDQAGRFVADLTRENFTVLEDGVPQKIESFTLVRGGRLYNLLQPGAPPAGTEGLVLPQSKPRTDDTSGRVLLVFIDDLHFEPEYSPHVRKLMETIVDTLVHDGDLVMVVSSGPSYLEIGPTYDKKMVREAVGKIRGSGPLPSELFKMLETSQGPGDIRDRARMAFFTAYKLLGDMERINNKRKAMIYVSTGYDFDPFVEGRLGRDRIQGGRFSDPMRYLIDTENPYFRFGSVTADIDLHALMRELVLSANRANATLYTIDPRGLSGVVDAGQYLDQSEWRTYLQKAASSLRFLAEGTGGFAVVNTNDFVGELKRIDAETSDYYLLGFYSSNPDPAKRTRTLDVKVDRPNVSISSRAAYSLKTEGKAPAPPPLKTKK
jgi:VWFA-related protein